MLGDNIRKIRKIKNISINNLSKITGVSLGYISDLENNKAQNPTIEKLKTIALALSVEVEDFFKSEPVSEGKLKEWDMKYNKDAKSTKEIKCIEAEISNTKKINSTLNIIPIEFTISTEARKYISMHQMFVSKGFNLNKMSDKDVLNFANEMLRQMKLISYKYKK